MILYLNEGQALLRCEGARRVEWSGLRNNPGGIYGGGGGGSDATDVCGHMRTAARRHPTSTVGGFRSQSVWTNKVVTQSTGPVDVEMFKEYVPELIGQNFESKAEIRTCLTQTGAKPTFI